MASQQVDLSRLKTILLTSGLQKRDNPLFQVINQLIAAVQQNLGVVSSHIVTSSSGSGASSIVAWDILTDGNIDETELIFAGGEAILTHMP